MGIHSTRLIRLTASTCAIGLVVVSAGFGAVFAWSVGSHHSILLAVLSVLMAVALEGIKPLAISQAIQALASFHLFRGLTLSVLGLVAIAYSLTAEISLVAMSKGDMAAERLGASDKAKSAAITRDRVTRELEAIGLVRPSGAIQVELNAVLSDGRLNNCEGWLASTKLRAVCIETVAPLRVELSKAERREALEAQLLRELDSNGSLGNLVADPGSKAIATYLGLVGLVLSVDVLSQWLVLVPVLALEVGSALAMVLVGSIPGSSPIVRAVQAEPHNLRAGPTPIKPRAIPSQQVMLLAGPTKQELVQGRILNHLKSTGGSWEGSERELAATLGTSKPTVRRSMQTLRESRSISVSATATSTRLELI